MQRTTTLGAAAAIAVAITAAAAPLATAAAPTILWSTTAPTATVAKTGGHYVLTMPGSSPTVWFTDRPARNAGNTTLQGFVGGWEQNAFDKVPPNAALVLKRDGVTTQTVVTLTRPQELANGKVRFRATALPTGEVMDMKTMNMAIPLGSFRNADLFIDAGDAPACPAMITSVSGEFWCTLSSSNDNAATVNVDLQAANLAGRTRTIRSCYWKGDHVLGATLYYRPYEPYDGGSASYTIDKTTPNCNAPTFSNLKADNATWSFAPVNSYYTYPERVRATRNQSVTFTLHSRKASYGGVWRFYSTPKVVLVVSDS